MRLLSPQKFNYETLRGMSQFCDLKNAHPKPLWDHFTPLS